MSPSARGSPSSRTSRWRSRPRRTWPAALHRIDRRGRDRADHRIDREGFWAGLRTGWVNVPSDWLMRMLATKTVADLGSPLLDQLLAVTLLEQVEEVRAERAVELRPRRDALAAALAERLPDWRFRIPNGGLSLWVQLPSGNAEEFTDLALEHGVAIVPGPALSVDDGNRRALRLAYVEDVPRLLEAVDRLVRAWAAFSPSAPPPSARLLI